MGKGFTRGKDKRKEEDVSSKHGELECLQPLLRIPGAEAVSGLKTGLHPHLFSWHTTPFSNAGVKQELYLGRKKRGPAGHF